MTKGGKKNERNSVMHDLVEKSYLEANNKYVG